MCYEKMTDNLKETLQVCKVEYRDRASRSEY